MQILDEILIHDPEFLEPGEQVDKRKKQLAAKLPPEDDKLLDDYEGSRPAQICRQEEIIFNEALMIGMLLGYRVALVGRGVGKITV